MTTAWPEPAGVDITFAWAPWPFVGCLGRMECEWAAAMYVTICQAVGAWRPVSPRDFGMLLGFWCYGARPPWVETPVMMGLSPDIHTLVKREYFTLNETDQTIMPTDRFFEAVRKHVLQSRLADIAP